MLNNLHFKQIRNKISFAGILFLAFVTLDCSSNEAIKQLSADERFALGMAAYKDEDYLAAIEEFKVVSLQYQGSRVADSAQFYMAECRYKREEYILAAFEYEVLIRNMYSSVFVPESRFKRATCYYELSPNSYLDQNYSRKAIDEYQAFIEYHPTDTLVAVAEQRINELNSKLAKKDYENGLTYMYMEYYKAATYYFDVVLDKYHDTHYAEPAMLKKAQALTNRKKYIEAKETVDKFYLKYPSSTLIAEAQQLQTEIESKRIEDEQKQKSIQLKQNEKSKLPQAGG